MILNAVVRPKHDFKRIIKWLCLKIGAVHHHFPHQNCHFIAIPVTYLYAPSSDTHATSTMSPAETEGSERLRAQPQPSGVCHCAICLLCFFETPKQRKSTKSPGMSWDVLGCPGCSWCSCHMKCTVICLVSRLR